MSNKAVEKAAQEFVLEYLQRDIEFMDICEKLDEGDNYADPEAVYAYVTGLLDDAALILAERYSEK